MSVRARFTLILIAMAGLALAAGAGAVWALHGMNAAVEGARHSLMDQQLATELQREFMDGSAMLTQLVTGESTEEARRRFDEIRQDLERRAADLDSHARSDAERSAVRDITAELGRFATVTKRILFKAKKGQALEASNLLRFSSDEIYRVIGVKVGELTAVYAQDAAAAELLARSRSRLAQGLLALGYLALLVVMGLGLYVVWLRIVRPLEVLEEAARRISRGERVPAIPIRTSDEFGRLARNFESMVQSIREYQEELVEKERMAAVGEMTASVAHNVRNPLASIRAVAQSCQRQANGQLEFQESMQTLIQTVDRADRWLKDLLMALRPVPVERRREDLNQIVREVAESAEEFARRREVRLRIEAGESLPALSLDSYRIHQALLALVINAVEASPAGAEVVLGTGFAAGDPTRVEIVVEDRGPGMDESTLRKIFSPFYSQKKSGTGLGLSLTRRIVFGHGGSISAESAPGKGCRMRILLPVVAQEAKAEHGADPDPR